MFCSNCGRQITNEKVRFCPGCGEAVFPQEDGRQPEDDRLNDRIIIPEVRSQTAPEAVESRLEPGIVLFGLCGGLLFWLVNFVFQLVWGSSAWSNFIGNMPDTAVDYLDKITGIPSASSYIFLFIAVVGHFLAYAKKHAVLQLIAALLLAGSLVLDFITGYAATPGYIIGWSEDDMPVRNMFWMISNVISGVQYVAFSAYCVMFILICRKSILLRIFVGVAAGMNLIWSMLATSIVNTWFVDSTLFWNPTFLTSLISVKTAWCLLVCILAVAREMRAKEQTKKIALGTTVVAGLVTVSMIISLLCYFPFSGSQGTSGSSSDYTDSGNTTDSSTGYIYEDEQDGTTEYGTESDTSFTTDDNFGKVTE